ncbi:MAG: hypothetical protein RIR70_1480 [Pseudomonadota bacterium]|jgi:hypothetical protein
MLYFYILWFWLNMVLAFVIAGIFQARITEVLLAALFYTLAAALPIVGATTEVLPQYPWAWHAISVVVLGGAAALLGSIRLHWGLLFSIVYHISTWGVKFGLKWVERSLF